MCDIEGITLLHCLPLSFVVISQNDMFKCQYCYLKKIEKERKKRFLFDVSAQLFIL